MWENLTITKLREIARYYNSKIKIAGVSKMKKEDLITELKKHLDMGADGHSVAHKTDKKGFKWVGGDVKKSGEPKVVAEYKPTDKEKMYKKEEKKMSGGKMKKERKMSGSEKELAELERKSAMKKKIKAQGEGAVADAKAIKPPRKTRSDKGKKKKM